MMIKRLNRLVKNKELQGGRQAIAAKGRGGFVFFDALLGVLLVSIAVVAIIWALTQNTKVVSYGNNYTKATYVAQAKLEELRKWDGASTALSSNVTLPATSTVLREGTTFNVTMDSHGGTQTILNDALPPASDDKVVPVKVTVSWSEAGKTESITMHAYYYSK